MNILDAIKHAIDGNAVLFLGSGFSYGAKNLLNSSPKTGREFASDLYKLAEVPSKDENLMIASQIYYRKFGAAALSTLCRETFTIKQAAPHHITIASLKWQRIYTTNYDDLAERSSIENGKSLTPVTLEDSPERYLSSSKVCVHINGFINRLTTSDLTSHFKLTLASYFSDHFSGSLWRRIFDQDLSSARAVIFVGYSMYDLDIQRFVYAADIKDKTVFICSPTLQENDSDSFILPEFGTLFPIGVQKFADEITEILGKYKPSPQPPLHQFRKSKLLHLSQFQLMLTLKNYFCLGIYKQI
ncbi:SIR2 family protein [Undibacterium umbellatum]|uniref:SIR2 family protein n=1 Tax=Undibacterium umbellatum TaxID=2762300 RepID=A0ABR6Z3S0_9BURK|nr:SIR2 family protein [Undibacterium umbellatum]MBC3905941.1 SIR2 family protein [Undibacterium umbellatum]